MILLMVVPSSAAFLLSAVCVSLDTRIMMFLSFLMTTSVYSLLYIIIHHLFGFVKFHRTNPLAVIQGPGG